MKWDDKDCIEVCSLSCIEYAEIYFYFLIYTEKILHNNGIRLDCCSKEEILRDALTEAFLLYNTKEVKITEPDAFKQWICKTAFYNFMNEYKSYKKVDFCDLCDLEKLPTNLIFEPDKDYYGESLEEHLSAYCTDEEIDLLHKHWIEGYKLKELSNILDKSEAALQQRHK